MYRDAGVMIYSKRGDIMDVGTRLIAEIGYHQLMK